MLSSTLGLADRLGQGGGGGLHPREPSMKVVVRCFLRDGRTNPSQAARRARPAQCRDFELANEAQKGGPCESGGGQGMFERRQKGERRHVARRHLGDQPEIRARHSLAKRRARRIVDPDVPAAEVGDDAARQVAVRRHQRGGASRCLQRPRA